MNRLMQMCCYLRIARTRHLNLMTLGTIPGVFLLLLSQWDLHDFGHLDQSVLNL